MGCVCVLIYSQCVYGLLFSCTTQMSNPLPNMINLKLILLGSSKVGKTSLIQRFSQNKFSETLPETVS